MRVFAEKGFEATTMKDIAAEMNVVSGFATIISRINSSCMKKL